MVHCWEKSGLLAAWEPASALEAGELMARSVLFTNTTEAGTGTEGAELDEEESTAEGAADWATAEPEPGAEPEYMQYVDWERWDAEQGVPV